MAFEVIWSAFAETQLDSIYKYYAENTTVKNAEKIIKKILQKPNTLIGNPHLGAVEELLKNRKENYRYLVTSHYKIIYSVDLKKSQIKIADVFDTRQNPIKLNRKK